VCVVWKPQRDIHLSRQACFLSDERCRSEAAVLSGVCGAVGALRLKLSRGRGGLFAVAERAIWIWIQRRRSWMFPMFRRR
jgi:hypothetical protein